MIPLLYCAPSEGGEAIQDWLFVLAPFHLAKLLSDQKVKLYFAMIWKMLNHAI